jgi:integrase
MGAKRPIPAGYWFDKSRKRWRVWYWDGGATGLGKRRTETATSQEHARDRVEEIGRQLAVAIGKVPPADLTLGEVAREFIASLGDSVTEGTKKTYRSDLNCYVLGAGLSAVPAKDVSSRHLAIVVDHLSERGLSVSTLTGAVRTVNALTKWGRPRGYFSDQAWGSREQRDEVLKPVRRKLRKRREQIQWDDVPACTDVEAFAEELESRYPGHGRNFVLVMAGSGLRVSEALGLRVEDIDIERCAIRVERQADRLQAWPAMVPPKDDEARTTYMWNHLRRVLVAMVDNADADGWIFPPDVEQFGTRGLWWTNRLTERTTEARRAAGWTAKGWDNKWCRHHYASFSLANPPWGWGIPIAVVSEALGHASQSTTLDHYSQKTGDAAAIFAQATAMRG